MGDTKCKICDKNTSKYSCPKCKILYCSLSCYRSEEHVECSEAFYKQWVQEQLSNSDLGPEGKKRMLEILKKFESDSDDSLDSDDDESEIDLSTRLLGVNLDDDKAIWDRLTIDEKKDFRKLITSGNILKILPEWVPWWVSKKKAPLVQDYQGDEFEWRKLCPPILTDIPQFSRLTKVDPSPTIPFMIINILASYAFTVRWFKGNHKELAVEAISTCVALSATLRENKVFNSYIEAFSTFESDFFECKWTKEAEYDRDVITEDIKDIVNGSDVFDPYFCIKSVLSDLEALTYQALDILNDVKSQQLRRFSRTPPRVSHLKQISRRMIFFLSWTTEHGSVLMSSLP